MRVERSEILGAGPTVMNWVLQETEGEGEVRERRNPQLGTDQGAPGKGVRIPMARSRALLCRGP